MSSSKIISSTKWVLGTVFLGALGSGMWDLFISDLFTWLGLTSLELASSIFSGFRDTLYEQVSDGAIVSFLKLPATLVAIALVMLPMILLLWNIINYVLATFDENEEEKENEQTVSNGQNSRSFTIRKLMISMMAIVVCAYVFVAFRYMYTAKAANFVEKSVDILAPHISVEKRLTLVATFKSVKDSEDYLHIYSELRELEKEHQVILPEFDPI